MKKLTKEILENGNWLDISSKYKLSENFIRENQDKVKWGKISIN